MSDCRLSFVALLLLTQRVELFYNIFAPTNSIGTRTVCIKILKKKKFKEVLGDRAS